MSPYSKSHRKPCARPSCSGIVKRPDSIYCSRRCGFMGRPTPVKITINKERGTMPKVATDSWWLNAETFYEQARKRFHAEAVR